MRIIKRQILIKFWKKHAGTQKELEAWYNEVKHAQWERPADIKIRYPKASILSKNRVVFRIKGNKLRIVVVIQYTIKTVYIRFIGTHAEYDKIDTETI
ncbi:MAG: type II toxin-antitoxin system HigB family toxin [Kiritimatiellae bacterium]|jgi:mRNA interferase HigB|nr:type II toxin-antitoxin system HigB family toxin [Kiritimatiellia bacterium]